MFRSLLLLACLSLTSPGGLAQVPGASWKPVRPTDPEIQYVGRWDFTNPEQPNCGWQGSSIRVRFEGGGLRAELSSGSVTETFRVVLDGDYAASTKVFVGARKFYALAKGLGSGAHVIELVKETYHGTNSTLYGLEVAGRGLVAPPALPGRRIEFYGDSNLAGHSLESEENKNAADLIGSTLGYAGITSRIFDAQYHNISVSGGTLKSMNKRFDRITRFSEDPRWDFSRYSPDLVVMNLGANNVGNSKSSIMAAYHTFLDDLRAVHPNAHIMLYNAWGWDYNETANYIDEVITARNDPNMSWAVFPWLFPLWHGCEADHGGMAEYLARHLESVLGWQRSKAADVLCGYGMGGDVANGSFEEVAPFGGYGWRYFDRPGVQRIKDASQAQDGKVFVRLVDQPIFQPNPANNGDTFTVQVWLRGGKAGDQVNLTIDFRDQKMWTNPLQSDTERKTLSSSWQLFTISATAPATSSMPVFHTRFTIQPVKKSAVIDVDSISMTRF